MKTIGELVEETLDYSDRGLLEIAFLPACYALQQAAELIYTDENNYEPKFQRFIRENWQMISFMGIMRNDKIPADMPFGLRRAVSSLNMPNLSEEIIIYAVRQTLATRRLPFEIGFNKFGGIELEKDKLLFSKTMLFAIVGSVIFNPVNKNEQVADKYWLNVWDFKMFISELWGRDDLIQRIMQAYQ